MIYEMGRSIKMGYKAIIMQTYYFTLLSWGFLFIFNFSYSMNTILYFLEIVGISLFVSVAISGFVNYFGYRKSYENFGALSEQIFEKLGFEYPKEQHFYNEFLTDGGVQISVMKYRNKLKGHDPYPEDYFDKKRAVETLN